MNDPVKEAFLMAIILLALITTIIFLGIIFK